MATNAESRTSTRNGRSRISRLFADIAQATSREAGRAWVFILAVAVIVTWGITGPLFGFSDTWQLVINTGTTIVTFLMVFLIQNSQNRDGAAIQVKLDELIRVSKVRNSFVGIEHLTDEELEELRTKCESRARGAGRTQDCAPPDRRERRNGRTKSPSTSKPSLANKPSLAK